jgi:hypothetical protein
MPTEHQIWTTDENGRDILVATTRIGSDAGVVFDAVVDARSFVEWRTAAHGQHKGRLFRGWDGDKHEMYGPAQEANLA